MDTNFVYLLSNDYLGVLFASNVFLLGQVNDGIEIIIAGVWCLLGFAVAFMVLRNFRALFLFVFLFGAGSLYATPSTEETLAVVAARLLSGGNNIADWGAAMDAKLSTISARLLADGNSDAYYNGKTATNTEASSLKLSTITNQNGQVISVLQSGTNILGRIDSQLPGISNILKDVYTVLFDTLYSSGSTSVGDVLADNIDPHITSGFTNIAGRLDTVHDDLLDVNVLLGLGGDGFTVNQNLDRVYDVIKNGWTNSLTATITNNIDVNDVDIEGWDDLIAKLEEIRVLDASIDISADDMYQAQTTTGIVVNVKGFEAEKLDSIVESFTNTIQPFTNVYSSGITNEINDWLLVVSNQFGIVSNTVSSNALALVDTGNKVTNSAVWAWASWYANFTIPEAHVIVMRFNVDLGPGGETYYEWTLPLAEGLAAVRPILLFLLVLGWFWALTRVLVSTLSSYEMKTLEAQGDTDLLEDNY